MLSRIVAWITQSRDGIDSTIARILWLHGPVGAGKSAIAQTICQKPETCNVLAGSFFSRGNDRRGTTQFFISTIAYQLCRSIPGIREQMGIVITEDPTIFEQSMDAQLRNLIIEPFQSITHRLSSTSQKEPFVIIIDGLDECAGSDNQITILNNISALIHTHHIPLVFLIASRPEHHIRQAFEKDPTLLKISDWVFLEPSDGDISLFLKNKFDAVRQSHDMEEAVTGPWPSDDDMEKLIQRSSGYFIYASTIIKFVSAPDENPRQQLALVLFPAPSPFKELDQLYHYILTTVPNHARLVRILGHILSTHEPLSPAMLSMLLGLDVIEVRLILRKLVSLLKMEPSSPWDSGYSHSSIGIIHASFGDFICSPKRGAGFYINATQANINLSSDVIDALRNWEHMFPGLAHCYVMHILPHSPTCWSHMQRILHPSSVCFE
jgi:hypothetical protein